MQSYDYIYSGTLKLNMHYAWAKMMPNLLTRLDLAGFRLPDGTGKRGPGRCFRLHIESARHVLVVRHARHVERASYLPDVVRPLPAVSQLRFPALVVPAPAREEGQIGPALRDYRPDPLVDLQR